MAFFLLEPDLMVPVKVSADGYENYASSISIASNITYLVEANLCKLVSTYRSGCVKCRGCCKL